jgi:hypothetical protein
LTALGTEKLRKGTRSVSWQQLPRWGLAVHWRRRRQGRSLHLLLAKWHRWALLAVLAVPLTQLRVWAGWVAPSLELARVPMAGWNLLAQGPQRAQVVQAPYQAGLVFLAVQVRVRH